MPFFAVLSLDEDGHSLYIKIAPVPGFTSEAISAFAKNNLELGSTDQSDGLPCFAAVAEAGCTHKAIVVGN